MEKLEEKTQELVQKQQKLDQTKQEPLDWGTASGRVCMRSTDIDKTDKAFTARQDVAVPLQID